MKYDSQEHRFTSKIDLYSEWKVSEWWHQEAIYMIVMMFDGRQCLGGIWQNSAVFIKKKVAPTSSIDERFYYISMVGFSNQTI